MDISDLVDGQDIALQKEQKQLELVGELAENGDLEADLIQHNPPEELPILGAAASSSGSGRDNESNSHVRLKAIGAKYLDVTGSDPLFEQRLWFGVADVATQDQNRVVECGTVRVGKMLEAFGLESSLPLLGEPNPSYETVDEFLYIPYTRNESYPPVTILSLQSK